VSTDNISENYLNWTPGSTRGYITAYNLGPKPLASDENETSLASFAALVIPQTVKENEYYLVINNRSEYSCYASKDIVWNAGHSYTYEVTITKESGVWVNNVSVSPWTPQDGGSLETE
ncbi:MAG: fimbrillin family protein, partial [Candidatus Bacteroides intestinipullorum]|nr:fimbrillin family protein [Candidatus Bacteroides intestinipullorum]